MEEVLDHNQEAEQIFRQYGRLLELVAAAQLPGRPEDAGILIETVLKLGPKIPILGVCLGHQAI